MSTRTSYKSGEGPGRGRGGRAAAAALPALLLALSPAAPAGAAPVVVDRVVAVVNDDVITLFELNSSAALKEVSEGLAPAKRVEVRSSVLDGLIEKLLMKQAADRAGIEVSEKEIDNAVEDVVRSNDITREQLLVLLARSGIGYPEYRDQLREEIRQAKFMNMAFRSRLNITEEALREHYNQTVDEYMAPPGMRLRVIFFEAGDAVAERVDAVMRGLADGADFAELARAYSDAPNASEGGEMGLLKTSEMNPAIAKAASRLAPGEVSAPVTTDGGVSIIQLVERKEAAPRPLEEVSEEVRDSLYKVLLARRYESWLDEMRRFANIEVRL